MSEIRDDFIKDVIESVERKSYKLSSCPSNMIAFLMHKGLIKEDLLFSQRMITRYIDEQQAIISRLKEENEQLKIANARWLDKSLQDRQIRYNNTNHKELTKKYLQLKEENEHLQQSVEYWQKKYEEGTETFQINENNITFQFNSNQAQLYTIKNVSPNGVVRLGNGHKAKWRMKDVREINAELPPFEDFNRELFHEIRNKMMAKFDKDVLGRIIYNIYKGTFEGLM